MKIKKINEDFENNVTKITGKIKNIKKVLEDVFYSGNESENKSTVFDVEPYTFEEYWDKNGDKLILELGILEKDEPKGNSREILPQMVSVSRNSQITQQTANRIAEKFTKAELNDFKRWLQLIEENSQTQKKRW